MRDLCCFNKLVHQKSLVMNPVRVMNDYLSVLRFVAHFDTRTNRAIKVFIYLTLPLRWISTRKYLVDLILTRKWLSFLTSMTTLLKWRITSHKCLNFLSFKTTNIPFQYVCPIRMVLVLILLNRTCTILGLNCLKSLLVETCRCPQRSCLWRAHSPISTTLMDLDARRSSNQPAMGIFLLWLISWCPTVAYTM
jgi:hypothetical protein